MVQLDGGNDGGAAYEDGTVRRRSGPWTTAVASLLTHLERVGFSQAPRFLGIDAQGREELTFLPGRTVGSQLPWPAWTHSDSALDQVGRWLRRYHDALDSYEPPSGAVWRTGRAWRPGDVIGHTDAAPYNAVWSEDLAGNGSLVGFIDWDHAGPTTRVEDLASVVFSWVPLHAREVVEPEGFTTFGDRRRRLDLLLDAYGSDYGPDVVLRAVQLRVTDHAADLRTRGAIDMTFRRLDDDGIIRRLDRAVIELSEDFGLPLPPDL